MGVDDAKMMLAEDNEAEAMAAHAKAVDEFLDPEHVPANVVGLGVGVKWSNGQPTGEPAVLALVSQKVDEDMLRSADVIPSELGGMQTDVLAVGELLAGGEPIDAGVQTLRNRIRPAEGGYSVGHVAITAGTIATCVYAILPEAGRYNPGIGIPNRYFILSNNHVLANSNNANLGDPVLQPGPFDGGTDPADRIGSLAAFVPITFWPPVPLNQHRNLVDAAIATVEFHDGDREIYWIGYVRAWMRRSQVKVGMLVQKTGRTTNYTVGRITTIAATVNVNYGGGRVARFVDQIVTTNMSAGGDSGSLVTTFDNVAVGLLFAGSPSATILNQIEHVRRLLRVEVAEEVV